MVDKTTSQIITSQGSEGADVKQLYPKVVKLVQDDLVAKKISGVTLPTLEQIVDTGTGTTGKLPDEDLYDDEAPVWINATLKGLEKDGFNPTPFENVADKKLASSQIFAKGKTKTEAQQNLGNKLTKMKVDQRNGQGSIFYKEAADEITALWVMYRS